MSKNKTLEQKIEGAGGPVGKWQGGKGASLKPSVNLAHLLTYTTVVGLCVVSLWFRLRFIHTVQLYPDEFVTLLAVRMIGEKGLPLLPSGLFYEHGLLFSYFGSLAALFGPTTLTLRYLSLFFGLLTLVLTFYLGRRWFSPAVGLIAAAGLALAPTAIQWSGRARMYALLQLLILLTLWLAYEGIVHRQAKLRWAALLIYLAACLTHFVAVTLAPPFIIFVIIWWLYETRWQSSRVAREQGSKPESPISNLQSPIPNPQSRLPEALALTTILLIAFLVKRLGQPKGLDPLAAQESLSGLAQVFALYSDFSFDLSTGWQALNPFYFDLPALIFVPFALITMVVSIVLYWRIGGLEGWRTGKKTITDHPTSQPSIYQYWRVGGVEGWRDGDSVLSNPPTLQPSNPQSAIPNPQSPISNLPISTQSVLTTLLLLTTLEMVLFVSPDRRDDKYLFMLLPVLFLLGAQGMGLVGRYLFLISIWVGDLAIPSEHSQNLVTPPNTQYAIRNTYYVSTIATIFTILLIFFLTKPHLDSLLANTGDDYATAFAYVQAHWQNGDAILTGTPAAAALYVGHNDFYGVQRQGGYDYRLLTIEEQAVDRWLGSPAIRTEASLQQTLAGQRVWLVLERWGLQREYYDLPFQQQLLVQTDHVEEVGAQGIFVLRSKPNPRPIALNPAHPIEATLGEQVQLVGYTVEPEQPLAGQALRLTLYWRALTPLPHDYTVFVHLRQLEGGNVTQADHRPLGVIYPTTLWPVGETIRESSELYLPPDLPSGPYQLWTGLYLLDTGERLPVQNDPNGENAVQLGQIIVE